MNELKYSSRNENNEYVMIVCYENYKALVWSFEYMKEIYMYGKTLIVDRFLYEGGLILAVLVEVEEQEDEFFSWGIIP